MTLDSAQLHCLKEAAFKAAGRADAREAVGRIYHELQTRIDARKPLCVASGKCCKFEEFGHRLFITTLELAKFLYDWETGDWPDGAMEALRRWDGGGCPFQIEKLCGVHLVRPFGCRIFFCDSTATEWQQERYEEFHSEISGLHESLNVPYFYVEWREGLKAVGIVTSVNESRKS